MWKTVKLNEIVNIDIGKTPSRNNPKYWDKNKKDSNVWVSIRDMSALKGLYVDDSREYISNEGAKLFKEVPKNTLIMSFKLSIGKLAITKINLRTNEAIAAFKIKDTTLVSNEYLYYFLSSMNWDRIAGHDIKVKGKTLNKAKLREILIILPSLAEQQRIVAKLDATFSEIDKSINITEHKKKETDILRQNILAKELKIGTDVKKLSDVCQINNGGTPDSKNKLYWGDNNHWLTPKDMGKLSSHHVDASERQITDEGLNNSSARLVPQNSVILSCRAPIGYLAINSVPMSFNQGCKGLVPKPNLLAKYLYYFLLSSKQLLNDLGSGTTFKEISSKTLSNVIINIPSLIEQKRIVAKLDLTFAEVKKIKSYTEKQIVNYQTLKSVILTKELQKEAA